MPEAKRTVGTVLLVFLLLFAAVTVLCACEKNEDTPTGTVTDAPTVTVTDELSLTVAEKPTDTPTVTVIDEQSETVTDAPVPTGIDLSLYKVIRAEKCTELVKSAAAYLKAELQKQTGLNIPIGDDWVKRGTDTASDEIKLQYEILVGVTNRPESAADETLDINAYKITATGNKVVICGGSDAALYEACRIFLTLAVKEGERVMLPEAISYLGEYKPAVDYLILVTDQKNSEVGVYDLNLGGISTTMAKKTFKCEEYNIADARLREYEGKTVVLAAYGSSSAKMFDYETGNIIWSTNMTANNPHAAELLPGGIVAVAASNGGEIRFYDVKKGSGPVATVALPDSHGLLWDPQLKVMWAVGRTVLTAYEVVSDGSTLNVTEKSNLKFSIPTDYAHDLQPYHNDTDKLWITTSSAVYVFSKSQKTFLTSYDGSAQVNKKNVKGIGNFTDGSIIYIVPDKVFRDWTSATLYFVRFADGKYITESITSSDGGFYKVRVADKKYQ